MRRDFTPGVFNFFADPAQLERTLAEPTFNDFAHTLEGAASFAVANIHGSGHFGVGGILGQAGNAANSPGGKSLKTMTSASFKPLSNAPLSQNPFSTSTTPKSTTSTGNGNKRTWLSVCTKSAARPLLATPPAPTSPPTSKSTSAPLRLRFLSEIF